MAMRACFVLIVLAIGVPALARRVRRDVAEGVSAAPTVTLDYITLAGNSRDGFNEFLGIPYAASPVGNLRWKPPQPPVKVSGVYNATKWTPACLQTPNSIVSVSSEDCLFLHVWTPATATPSSRLPVFVWIHGGGFSMDAAQSYPGDHVITGYGLEAVIVSMDYRLGALGFFATPALFAEGGANFGLLDQEYSLQWVQKYITQFGGNPNHVTVFGESAGAGSVALHMTMRGGQNKLFQYAILESGSFTTYHETPTIKDMASGTTAMATATGCTQTDPAVQLACFRQAAAATVLTVRGNFWPCVDGILFKDLPSKLVERGEHMKVPTLFGTNTNEGAGMVSSTLTHGNVESTIRSRFPSFTADNITLLLNTLYPAHRFASSHLRVAELEGDEMMACVSEVFSNVLADAGVPTYRYRFNHAPENSYQQPVNLVAHATELPLVFNVTTYQPLEKPEFALVSKIMATWKAFGLTGNPNTGAADDPFWPEWDSNTKQQMVLDYAYTLETKAEYMPLHEERCAFWRKDFASADSTPYLPTTVAQVKKSRHTRV